MTSGLTWDLVSYWICFGLGTIYATLSALLTGIFGFGHGGDVPQHIEVAQSDFGVHGGVEGGHGEAFASDGPGEAIIAPLSPATISVFMAVFGGTGILLRTLAHMPVYLSMPISVAAGLLVASVIFVTFYRFSVSVQASSEPTMREIIGLTGEVTVPIPKDGVGEIACICRGSRLVSTARSQDGVDIPRHSSVRVVRQVGNTMYVSPLRRDECQPMTPDLTPPNFKD